MKLSTRRAIELRLRKAITLSLRMRVYEISLVIPLLTLAVFIEQTYSSILSFKQLSNLQIILPTPSKLQKWFQSI